MKLVNLSHTEQHSVKYGDYEATKIMIIVDGVSYLLPQQVTKAGEGCKDFISSTITTPNLPSGKYHLEATIQYDVNPLRTIEYHQNSEEFYIHNPQDN